MSNSIFNRDRYRCRYCGVQLTNETATVDHVIPKSKGGTGKRENLVTCCKKCNTEKSDSTGYWPPMSLSYLKFLE